MSHALQHVLDAAVVWVGNPSPVLLEMIAFRDSLFSVISSGLHSLTNRVHVDDLTATTWLLGEVKIFVLILLQTAACAICKTKNERST